MAGSNRSMIIVTAVNLRTADTATYYPAHSKNGNNVSQRIVLRAVGNIANKSNDGKGETIGMNITAWNKLADVLARSMSEGKEFSATLKMHTYKGRVYFKPADGSKAVPVNMQTAAGLVAVETEKTSFEIEKILFGAEAEKVISREILEEKTRPADWNVAGSPGHTAWLEILKARNAVQYTKGMKKFGYARVVEVEGPGIGAYVENKQSAPATAVVGTAAAVAAAVAAVPPPAPPAEAPAPAPSTAVISGM
ncbi:MAG: hypothetical protein EHM38_07715 [Geobacteraceae bacterium]|nr:MAG: hypothetical protein EHM38_07715 [Geobacteraceae bacterium]